MLLSLSLGNFADHLERENVLRVSSVIVKRKCILVFGSGLLKTDTNDVDDVRKLKEFGLSFFEEKSLIIYK